MWRDYINANHVEEVLKIIADLGPRARIVAGATDLILEIERGIRTGIDTLIDVTRIPELDRIHFNEDGYVHLGPMVTHNHCVASKLIREKASPLARAAWEIGAPQIRNRGTVAGNVITASPANDTITPLMALGAHVTLRSLSGERVVPLDEFYAGVRQTAMRPDEMLVDIAFPAMTAQQRGVFLKLGLRHAQAISVVNVSAIITFDDPSTPNPKISAAKITLGAVAPTIIHASEAESFLVGRSLDESTLNEAARLAMDASSPIDDLRGSASYRREMVRVLTARGLRYIANNDQTLSLPDRPVLLWGRDYSGVAHSLVEATTHMKGSPIMARINGQDFTFYGGQDGTLLDLLREEAGLIGTKEGCAEGECGACTVFLDGMAVMSCLVPAPRAHKAEITTVEGLKQNGKLHPVQEAFINEGAVQCGYCTPGFLMSAAMLLDERGDPGRSEIQQAITGNLCRCTGYYKIISAIEAAVRQI